ncbi:cobalt-precorrin-8X methylmutase CbiC [Gottschalkia purinilytica]|uniref:Cobalt-precorrin-8X methylmutase CbiC n=1 Tax=Gottschalkia purinilytica TaxID=1503 RepID=A0A0L0W711_GOTPU|nr:precorrin-8X methylmutase [Gottschalkia purinilytica]KNF07343.1 cobalt-precorrin-8X methylmutase CbiC [Gottschalkia purinilytica]
MYIKDPMSIENKSFDIINDGMNEHNFTEQELKVVQRTIHTTGDFDYQNIVMFKNNPIEVGIEAIKSGCRIVTDTKMAFSGINKGALSKANCTMDNYIAREEVFKMAKEKEITRSMAAMDFALQEGVDIFVIGNAPTALFRIGELINEGKVSPKLIIGVPVGFVGASESKEYIREFNIPTITTKGTKGGSNVAAAIVNALLYMAVGR